MAKLLQRVWPPQPPLKPSPSAPTTPHAQLPPARPSIPSPPSPAACRLACRCWSRDGGCWCLIRGAGWASVLMATWRLCLRVGCSRLQVCSRPQGNFRKGRLHQVLIPTSFQGRLSPNLTVRKVWGAPHRLHHVLIPMHQALHMESCLYVHPHHHHPLIPVSHLIWTLRSAQILRPVQSGSGQDGRGRLTPEGVCILFLGQH